MNGILFNHESPRRGGTFVTKKVTAGVAQICAGIKDKISLGNLEAKRDWGHAHDYVRGMWMMLQSEQPEDFVLATGKQYSVRQLVELSFAMAGHPIKWQGDGIHEEAIDTTTGKVVVVIDEKYYRPTEVETLLGDPTKAMNSLGWKTDIGFEELVYDMMNHDFQFYGMELPENALQYLPSKKLTKKFSYPDIERRQSNPNFANHPEVSVGTPTMVGAKSRA